MPTREDPIRPDPATHLAELDEALTWHPSGCECGLHPFSEPTVWANNVARQTERIFGTLSAKEREVLAKRFGIER